MLIIDDSAVVRQTLTAIPVSDPEIEAIGAAADPFVATSLGNGDGIGPHRMVGNKDAL